MATTWDVLSKRGAYAGSPLLRRWNSVQRSTISSTLSPPNFSTSAAAITNAATFSKTTLPAATASPIARRIPQMMILAVLACMAFTTSGLAVSYTYDFPTGPTIILVGGVVYLAVVLLTRLRSRRNA